MTALTETSAVSTYVYLSMVPFRFPLLPFYKTRRKYDSGACSYSVTIYSSLCNFVSQWITWWMSYEVENITVKYLNFNSTDASNPFDKSKLTDCYKTKPKEWTNYSETKKTVSSQLQSDHQMGTNRGLVWLQSGRWGSHYYQRLIFNLNSYRVHEKEHTLFQFWKRSGHGNGAMLFSQSVLCT